LPTRRPEALGERLPPGRTKGRGGTHSTAPSRAASSPAAPSPGVPSWVGLVPLLLFLALFLLVPAITVIQRSLTANDGTFSFDGLKDAFTGQNLDAFKFSVRLSLQAAFVGAIVGTALASAATSLRRPRWLRSVVTSFSGVAANLGGIPLAFAFIALLGRQGLLTKMMSSFGYELYGGNFTLDSTWGLTTVYSYFNIPLMLLVTLPAIDGLQSSWREACSNLGGTTFTYWKRVALPVLAPSLLGGFLLLFANSFSAFATAAAISQTSLIVPLRIGFYLRGDVSANEDQLGYALATWMIMIMVVSMGCYWLLRRRAERWQQ
jgi:putative spermidine/putrescine transport system permease protein